MNNKCIKIRFRKKANERDLLDAEEFGGSTTAGFSSFDLVADRSGYLSFDFAEFTVTAGSSLMDSAMALL